MDLVAPRTCPGCDATLCPGSEGFCDVCAPLLEPLRGGDAAFEYGGPIADAIQRFKYEGRIDLAGPLGRLLAEACLSLSGRVDSVVHVPLHRRRRRERGFDQTALLAVAVARALDIPLDGRRLKRIRHTPPQAQRGLSERQHNIHGAFVAREDRRRTRVLLIDDVRTTGATLTEAAGVLRQSGTVEVRAFALAAVV